jgi:hypothetical protein
MQASETEKESSMKTNVFFAVLTSALAVFAAQGNQFPVAMFILAALFNVYLATRNYCEKQQTCSVIENEPKSSQPYRIQLKTHSFKLTADEFDIQDDLMGVANAGKVLAMFPISELISVTKDDQ